MREKNVVSWVVYKMTVLGQAAGANAVCEQSEWDEMEQARPGYHTLVRAGIANEGEAERVAREAPGGTTLITPRLKRR
jgi:hypothetical protein